MITTQVALDACQTAPPPLLDPASLLPCEPRQHGLYSVAPPVELGPHGQNGYEWIDESCSGMAHSYCQSCQTPGDPKVFDPQGRLARARAFSAYGSFSCSGVTPEYAQEKAYERLLKGEERRTEREFLALLRAEGTADMTPPSGTPSLAVGLAILGDFAGEMWPCLPVFHATAGMVHVFANQRLLATNDNDLSHRLYDGSAVVFGGGYDSPGPNETEPDPGEAWIWATGLPHVWRDEVFEPTTEAASAVNRDNNDVSALAERTIVVGHECGSIAVKVSLS